MEMQEAIRKVEASTLFTTFKEKFPDAYLVHAFCMHATGKEHEWQIGYFLPKTEKLVVFKTEPLERLPEDEAFNKGEAIKALDMEKVKLSYSDAKDVALELQQQEWPAEQVTKVIAILQHLEKQVYNFTLVLGSLQMLNVRVDAATGKIIKKELRSIMSLRQSDKTNEE